MKQPKYTKGDVLYFINNGIPVRCICNGCDFRYGSSYHVSYYNTELKCDNVFITSERSLFTSKQECTQNLINSLERRLHKIKSYVDPTIQKYTHEECRNFWDVGWDRLVDKTFKDSFDIKEFDQWDKLEKVLLRSKRAGTRI